MFKITEEMKKRGRHKPEWLNDIQEWCNVDRYSIYKRRVEIVG